MTCGFENIGATPLAFHPGAFEAGTGFDYFFLFDDEAAARADALVGPFFGTAFIRPNIWPFDLGIPQFKFTGYWVMVQQSALTADFLASPNLKYFLVTQSEALYQTYFDGYINSYTLISYQKNRAIYAENWN